ncbi:MAG TPA: glycoside hydrolase family 27 protein [Aggregatilineales bacterium]|nr:glycoside hydrolase family 27 protein [Aggregatilineales bacterium]
MSLHNRLAPSPPLGWNSWDCYGPSVTEAEVKANADFMAGHLLGYGWNYVVVDIQWYEPLARAGGYRPHAALEMDAYGRLIPAVNRFPSAAGGRGFKPLADYVHSLGLKFGIHIMRGIPRQAVDRNTPFLNPRYHASEVADLNSPCPWNTDMFGLAMSRPGAQAYYDSITRLYAEWDVDYIKADDMLSPYHQLEIEALSSALSRCGREIVLSLSPGVDLSLDYAEHLKEHAELWRVSADFWDRWSDLKHQFDLAPQWAPHIGSGHWPDLDMLPLGRIGIRAERGVDRPTAFSRDEQIMLMTLWSIARSPLMFGGDLPSSDAFTLSLLTNTDVIAVNQTSRNNRELFRQGDKIAWIADAPDSSDRYLALFNLGDKPDRVEADYVRLSMPRRFHVHDLWEKTDRGWFEASHGADLRPHAARLLRIARE